MMISFNFILSVILQYVSFDKFPFVGNETSLSLMGYNLSSLSLTGYDLSSRVLSVSPPQSVELPFFGNISVPAFNWSALKELQPSDMLRFDSLIGGIIIIPGSHDNRAKSLVPYQLTGEEEVQMLRAQLAKAKSDLEDANLATQAEREISTAALKQARSEHEDTKVKLRKARSLLHISTSALDHRDNALKKATLREHSLKQEIATIKAKLYDTDFDLQLEREFWNVMQSAQDTLRRENDMWYQGLYPIFLEAQRRQTAAENQSAAVTARWNELLIEKESYRERLALYRDRIAVLHDDQDTIDKQHALILHDIRQESHIWLQRSEALQYEKDTLQRENSILASALAAEEQASNAVKRRLNTANEARISAVRKWEGDKTAWLRRESWLEQQAQYKTACRKQLAEYRIPCSIGTHRTLGDDWAGRPMPSDPSPFESAAELSLPVNGEYRSIPAPPDQPPPRQLPNVNVWPERFSSGGVTYTIQVETFEKRQIAQ